MSGTASCVVAAAAYGTADAISNNATKKKKLATLPLLVVVEATAAAVSVPVLWTSSDPAPSSHAALLAMCSGCAGLIGLAMLNQAFSFGPPALVAPLSGLGGLFTIIFAPGTLTALNWVGVSVALAAILAAGRTEDSNGEDQARARATMYALAASVAFACGYWTFGKSAAGADVGWSRSNSVPWAASLAFAAALVAVLAVMIVHTWRSSDGLSFLAKRRLILSRAVPMGTLEIIGSLFYGYGFRVVGVTAAIIASLGVVLTAVIGWFDGERNVGAFGYVAGVLAVIAAVLLAPGL